MPIIRSSPLRAATVTLALLAAALLGASSAAARSTSAQLAARQVLVSFKHGTPAARVDALLARAGLRRVRTLSDIGTIVTRADGPRAAARATASLRASGATRYVERDGMAYLDSVPNDPYYSLGGSSGTSPYTLTKLEQGWDYATPSSAPIVAVVDSGVNAAEPDLAGAVMTGYNVFDGTTDTADVLGHGTAVASIVAAHRNNGVGGVGVCDGCQILPVRVVDASNGVTFSNGAIGIDWATDHGARVINLSFGGPNGSVTIAAAIQYAQSHGALVVASAGNSGSSDPNGCDTSSPPVCGGYPAAYSGVLSVAASNGSDQLYSWSNHGNWVQVAAPGCMNAPTFTGGYGVFCGTSAAAPFVSGLAGLILSVQPALTAAVVQNAIQTSSDTIAGVDVVHGRVNALATLAALGIAVAPANTAAPSLSGTTRDGQTLTATSGTWTGSHVQFSYTWSRSPDGTTWATVGSGSSYLIVPTDVGSKLRVTVTGSNALGSVSVDSAASTTVVATPAAVGTLTLSGEPRAGQTVTVTGAISGTPPYTVTYAWSRSFNGVLWTPVSTVTGASYALGSADIGATVRVRVTATNAGGSASGTVVSGVVGNNGLPPNIALELTTDRDPAVGGQVVYQLRVYNVVNYGPSWSTLATATLPDQVKITSAYTPHGSCTFSGQKVSCDLEWLDTAQSVTVLIAANVSAGGTLTATAAVSAQGELVLTDNNASLTQTVAAVTPRRRPPPDTTPPGKIIKSTPALPSTIRLVPLGSGKLAVGSTLTVTPALTTGGLHYRWQVRGAKGYTNLRGQTAPTLHLTGALVGKRVRVIASNGSQTRISAPTAPIRKR